ncbi:MULTISPECIES: hypothetical protein [Sorangium]|uniref:Uncharacterized protein n=1 Tax=Sorangium cellulosum TaxID=56 RepID=A0A4P2R392_SORCE|nr:MULTISPECIES: hypothetical protein [Sorangium]AUX37148.1 hypothetical protein SOCE836_093700 [Sorangium cellulosum]WCQ96438.1 hypothetical protein NQZ70_09225 [Sorangium sp. Soce836]
MSTAHQEAHAAAAHDVSDHHGFDGEPARALPADEPPTPNWVPALGLAVFAVAGVLFLAMSSDGDAAAQAAPAGARPVPADARPAAARPAPGADARPAGARPVAPTGPGSGPAAAAVRPAAERAGQGRADGAAAPGPANLRKLTPQEVEAVRKRIEGRQKGASNAPPPAPPK